MPADGVPARERVKGRMMPIQDTRRGRPGAPLRVPEAVYMAAYEVYCANHGEQRALIEGNCRSGFGTSELIALLYARGFPRTEWRQRERELYTEFTNV